MNSVKKLVYAAVCLALCMVLPLLTGHIPTIGNMLSPMHIPVLLCGFICGPVYGLVVGLIAPVLRHFTFGFPGVPTAYVMTFELAIYGLTAGLLWRAFPKKTPYLYAALILAMLAGRVMYGIASYFLLVILGLSENGFTFQAFLAGAFINAWPGIIAHIVLIPLIVMALSKAGLMPEGTAVESAS